MAFALSQRSLDRLQGVHPDLVAVVKRAIELTTVDFMVLEGLRTKERQAELVAAGASQTTNSRHITGHAVDLGAIVGGKLRWDWPLYPSINTAMRQAATELKVALEWGGDWRTLRDGPHWQLSRKVYP